MPSPAPEHHGLAFRRLALLCTALLSCTTLRTPVSTIEPEVDLRGGGPEPQLELWVESDRPLTPAEAEQFRGEARSALEKALEGRSQPEGGDELVVIRAQGVTRTREHRHDQAAATVGLVVGAVAIVAVVIVAIVAGGKSSSGSHGHAPGGFPSASAPRGGSGGPSIGRSAAGFAHAPPRFAAAAVPAPRLPSAAPRVAAARPFPSAPAPRGFPAVPAPGSLPASRRVGGPAVSVDVEVGFWWLFPLAPDPDVEPFYAYEPPPAYLPPPPDAAPPGDEAAAVEPQGPAPAQPTRLALPPPDAFPVEERGFFDGDRLVLEATVLDRTTGEAIWAKRINRKADPRDARAVKEAVDALLAEDGWQAPESW